MFNISEILNEVKNKRAGKYASLYVYGTEAISKYYSKINLKNKRVLTIAGSGDQAVNAIYFDAKEVVCFDINLLSKYMLNLKVTSLIYLDYYDFLRFFGKSYNSGTFDYKIYLKFNKHLNKQTKLFFDSLYKYFNYNSKKVVKSDIFLKRDFVEDIHAVNYYLFSEKNYISLKNKLKNKKIKFINTNILNLKSKFKSKFDIINISNIPNFIFRRLDFDYTKLVSLFNDLSNLLTKNGKIVFCTYSKHMYPNKYAKKAPPLTESQNIAKIIKISNFKYNYFNFKSLSLKGFDKLHIFSK